jgi:hypothetical protein
MSEDIIPDGYEEAQMMYFPPASGNLEDNLLSRTVRDTPENEKAIRGME